MYRYWHQTSYFFGLVHIFASMGMSQLALVFRTCKPILGWLQRCSSVLAPQGTPIRWVHRALVAHQRIPRTILQWHLALGAHAGNCASQPTRDPTRCVISPRKSQSCLEMFRTTNYRYLDTYFLGSQGVANLRQPRLKNTKPPN